MKTSTLVFYAQTEENTHIFKFPDNAMIKGQDCYSYSVINSLAAYLSWKFPYLPAPQFEGQFQQKFREDIFPDVCVYTHPMFTHWIDLLVDSVTLGKALRMGDTLYFKINISLEYANLLQLNGFRREIITSKMTWETINPLLNEEKLRAQRGNKHILMLICTLTVRTVASYHAPGLFMGLFYNNENWKYFRILKNEFPEDEDFRKATQVIISGSPLCISINIEPQIHRVIGALRQLFKANPDIRYLGICYGHQVLSETLSPGSVKRAKTGIYRQETINFIQSQVLSKFNFLKDLKSININEIHSDEISRVPDGFTLLAQSTSCGIEAMISNDGRILTFQGHPQYVPIRHRCVIALNKVAQQNITKEQMLEIIRGENLMVDQSLIAQEVLRKYLNQ